MGLATSPLPSFLLLFSCNPHPLSYFVVVVRSVGGLITAFNLSFPDSLFLFSILDSCFHSHSLFISRSRYTPISDVLFFIPGRLYHPSAHYAKCLRFFSRRPAPDSTGQTLPLCTARPSPPSHAIITGSYFIKREQLLDRVDRLNDSRRVNDAFQINRRLGRLPSQRLRRYAAIWNQLRRRRQEHQERNWLPTIVAKRVSQRKKRLSLESLKPAQRR